MLMIFTIINAHIQYLSTYGWFQHWQLRIFHGINWICFFSLIHWIIINGSNINHSSCEFYEYKLILIYIFVAPLAVSLLQSTQWLCQLSGNFRVTLLKCLERCNSVSHAASVFLTQNSVTLNAFNKKPDPYVKAEGHMVFVEV